MECNFFDSVYQQNPQNMWDKLSNACEDYFVVDKVSETFGYRKFRVIEDSKIELDDTPTTKLGHLLSIVKIISYICLIPPLLFLIGKALYRQGRRFEIIPKQQSPKTEPELPKGIEPTRIHQANEILNQAIKEVRNLRDDKGFVPPFEKNAAWCEGLRRTSPACQMLEKLPHLPEKEFCLLYKNPNLRRPTCDEQKQNQLLLRGSGIEALGVEEGKGGLTLLINIILEGLIRSRWSGPLGGVDAAVSAGPHGPFYVILDSDAMIRDIDTDPRLQARYTDEKYHVAYIVPDSIHAQIIFEVLQKAVEVHMLTEAEAQQLRSKVKTYDEMLSLSDSELSNSQAVKEALQQNRTMAGNVP